MPWPNGILLITITLLALSSSLRAFSKMDAAYGAVSEDRIHFGKLLIGAKVPDDEMKTSDLGLAEQSEYLSNEEARFHLTKTKLQRLGTTVHCGNDSMTLRVPGPRTPHFLVDQGEGSSVPLSEIPASCGLSLKRVRRDVSLVAPYKGCHVRNEGGSYILPLIIMGAPVQMSCPVRPRLPMVSCSPSGMTASLGVRAEDVYIKVAGSWQPLLLTYSQCSFTLETVADSLVVKAPFTGSCWEIKDTDGHISLLYDDRELTLSCPLMATVPSPVPTVPVQDPAGTQQMFYPFPFGSPWWYPYPNVDLTAMRPTTTTPPPPPPQDPISQQFFYPMRFNPYFYYKGGPTLPLTTTTTTPAPPPPQDPVPQPFFYPTKGFNPYYFYYKGAPTLPLSITTTTTPPPQDPIPQQFFYPMKGFDPYSFYNKGYSTTTPPPPQDPIPQQGFYPMKQFDPYFYYKGTPSLSLPQDPIPQRTGPLTFYGSQPKRFAAPNVKYPFMPQYPQSPVFAPRSLRSASSPDQQASTYRSRRHTLK